MLAQHHPLEFPNHQFLNFDYLLNKTKVKSIKREIMSLVEFARLNMMKIKFENLSDIINDHIPHSCNHHMISCVRDDDPLLELAVFMKAAEICTVLNEDLISINLHF